MMTIASIDIGTNTVLLLIARVDDSGTLTVLRDEHEVARLGRGVDADRRISDAAVDRVSAILEEYVRMSSEARCDRIVACGTSALRDAVNRDDVVAELKRRSGVVVRVLRGEEEADLTYRGALSGFAALPTERPTVVLDIGGGSTEIVVGSGGAIARRTSIDIGAVRLMERFLREAPPHPIDLRTAQGYCRDAFEQLPAMDPGTVCVAVAGTPTTLASIDLSLEVYDRARVEGHVLSRGRIDLFFDQLSACSSEDLRRIPQIHPQRADIMLAGTVILREYLYATSLTGVIVSDRGLRYGLLLETAAAR